MDDKGLRAGHLAALCGAAATLISLWLPWYAIRFPDSFREALGGETSKLPGVFGELARGIVAAMPETITGTGWQLLHGADVALCLGACGVVVLVLASAGAFGRAVHVDSVAAARWISVAAGAGLVLTAYHVIARPAQSDLVQLRAGLWVAAGGCLLALVGGGMASSDRPSPSPAPRWVAEPDEDARPHVPIFDASASVPPPR